MPEIRLLSFKELDYPSGSVLNFYKGELYLAGDDAGELVILDTRFNVLRAVPLFPGTTGRIEKAIKADIEAGDFVGDTLWLFGSGSLKPHRSKLFQCHIGSGELASIDISTIYTRIEEKGINMLNIEAATFANEIWLLGNRSNRNHKQNYIVVLPLNFANDQENAAIKLIKLNPFHPEAGISGMCYNEKEDVLLLTFSTEETHNAYDDGKIGASFLAMIRNISAKIGEGSLIPDEWFHLSETDASFHNKKIESVTIDDEGNIYLSSDNDDGRTGLYKISFKS